MIKKHSDDPNVELAATDALKIINDVLKGLPKAETFDYGGHELRIGEYNVCSACTIPIAEAGQASMALLKISEDTDDPVIKEHLELASQLFKHEADAAIIRAEFHNGHGTEKILNAVLAFEYERAIGEDYKHSHDAGN